jgi:hypothetical protein
MEPPPNLTATSVMGPPPPATSMQVGSFLSAHEVEFAHPQIPPSSSRQRPQANTGGLNDTSANTHHVMNSNYNQI